MASDKNIFLSLKVLFKELTPGRQIALLLLVGATIFSAILITSWAQRPEYQLLYSDLDSEDAGAILTKLREQKVPYKITASGGSILVPSEKVYELRLEFATKGLPMGSSVGFEIFDNIKLGMTEFVQNINYQRALQGELTRTINSFSEVKNSRVHIVMSSTNLFLDEDKPASASIVLNLKAGRWLKDDQIRGIVYLVSSSISGLLPENVTIVDSNGNILSGLKEKEGNRKISLDQLEYQNKIEKNYENRIKTMLERALGQDKAVVRVACEMDFKKYEMTEEKYYPDNQVVRSEQQASTTTNEITQVPQGIPGVKSNVLSSKIELNKTNGAKSVYNQSNKTLNYEIGKITSHLIEPVGMIKKISVAVMVDGSYKFKEDSVIATETRLKKNSKDKSEKKKSYFPRTADEMLQLDKIVKSAISFNKARGDNVEIVNMPFEGRVPVVEYEEPEKTFIDKISPYKPYGKYVYAVIGILFLYIFILRPVLKWVTDTSIEEMEIFKQLPKTVKEIEGEYTRKTMSLPFTDKVSGMIASNDKDSMNLVKNWIGDK